MKTDATTVLLAGAVGFAAGLLYAPRSGPETRQKLRVQTEEAKMRVKNATDELKRQTADTAEQVKDVADSVKHRTKAVKDVATKHTEEARDEIKATV